MLDNFRHYYEVARKMQEIKFQGNPNNLTKNDVGDDLAWNVPIYDVVNRRYAAFSSFTEAIYYKHKDPKGNGYYFKSNTVPHDYHFATLCYLFRLCGSGINYKPITEGSGIYGTHGFGNFWIVDAIARGSYRREAWLDLLPISKFCDVKGYMLPQIKGGIRTFILQTSFELVDTIWSEINTHEYGIADVVDLGNHFLLSRGFQRQNFVLCAFAMDLAEYFPNLVNRDSDVLLGSNAKKCFKQVFPGRKNTKIEWNKGLQELCDITGNQSKKYDMEDVMCDFIRYTENFQSPDHIKANGGLIFKNSLNGI